MAYAGSGSASIQGDYAGLRAEGREPGARRKKLAGYLKAANELRQNYFSGDSTTDTHSHEDGPGAFPDAAVVRSGNEEMVLFPSYARKHTKTKPRNVTTPGREVSEEEFWRREWEKHEDKNAIVDVDVRGWIYTPPRGQNTRKQRLLIGLARQLSGIPAPPTSDRPTGSGSSSAQPSRASSPSRQQEQDLINFEAENIVRKGRQEESFANRGAFSEKPGVAKDTDSDFGSTYDFDMSDRGRQRSSIANSTSAQDWDPGQQNSFQKRQSWPAPAKMSSTELAKANSHLLTRLKPFMANPLSNTPISAFFFNESASKQQTVYTDGSGHFTIRAALDFVPTHVRVLAGEKLSATEEVTVTSPTGVSLISDIDDTIKHSAISAGAREIFRNAFIRELGDLTIEGVREWYNTLDDMGVKIHYVSNSPWQMYPILTSFFKLAHLPRGSFHLKQYSGMLQGIFEPVAERKKSSLDKIFRDFPDRKFILIGDSGEADLEIYTDTAMEYPGRVLGIFIRDVTTTVKTGYFDSNNSPNGSRDHSRNHSRNKSGDSLAMSKRISRPNDIRNDDADLQAAIAASLGDMEEEARRARKAINPDAMARDTNRDRQDKPAPLPKLPPRPTKPADHDEEDLIDFSDPPPPPKPWLEPPRKSPSPNRSAKGVVQGQKPSPSPPPPPKPATLRSTVPDQTSSVPDNASKPPPPRPRKPSSSIKPTAVPHLQTTLQPQTHQPSPLSQVTRQESTKKTPPALPTRPKTYREWTKETITKALPTPKLPPSPGLAGESGFGLPRALTSRSRTSTISRSQPTSPLAQPMNSPKSFEDLNLPESAMNRPAPPPPPRRNFHRRASSNRLSGAWSDDGLSSPGEGMSKKEYMWQQRWSRAKNILERNGVTLRSWKVGSDVADVCVKLVELEQRKIEKEQKNGQTT